MALIQFKAREENWFKFQGGKQKRNVFPDKSEWCNEEKKKCFVKYPFMCGLIDLHNFPVEIDRLNLVFQLSFTGLFVLFTKPARPDI